VRAFLVLLVGLVVIPASIAARAVAPATLSLGSSSAKALYGHRVTLTGTFTGARIGDRRVTIDARPYGTSAPHLLGAVRTDARGTWSIRVKPAVQTTYTAHVGKVMSTAVTIGVAPEMSVKVLANGRIRATVHGGLRFVGRFVELQTSHGKGWQTVARRRLSTASIAVFSATIPTSTIRVAMSINQAGAGYLGASSHPIAYHAETLTMVASSSRVLFGRKITLTGHVMPARSGEHVSIVARPFGHRSFVLAIVTTDRKGTFSVNASPTILTTYQANFGGTRESQARPVGVQPRITVQELSNGRVMTHVDAGAVLRGHLVQLQRLMPDGSTWQTIAKRGLSTRSSTTFALHVAANSMVRVAMSVNQAGAGYLGSTSHSLLYRAV
jgi:hypothetical protein